MTVHRLADVNITSDGSQPLNELSPVVIALAYHMLRTMGWEWLWECDSEISAGPPNHITDGAMEESGVADWTAVSGGSASKITTGVREGTQSLRVTATSTSGSGIRTAVLATMSDSEEYQIALWAKNSSGKTWTVEADDGGGLFSSIGTIPDNGGVWTLYVFSFVTDVGPGGSRYISVVCNDTPAGGEVIDIDWMICFRSIFEYPGDYWVRTGSDGELDNSDEFSSGGYSCQAGDIGKHLFVYDPANPTNTGCYVITGVVAGVATCDMRGRAFVTNTTGNLVWRIVDINLNHYYESTDSHVTYAGFALQSPHSSSWRWVCRLKNITGQTSKAVKMWASPVDGDINVQTGDFFPEAQSTQRRPDHDFTGGDVSFSVGSPKIHNMRCAYTYLATRTVRTFMLIDEDGAWFHLFTFQTAGGSEHSLVVAGYVGVDSNHVGTQGFCIFTPDDSESETNNVSWDDTVTESMHNGTGFDEYGRATGCSASVSPFVSSDTSLIDRSNERDNPYTSEEVLYTPRIYRDFSSGTSPSLAELSANMYIGRYASNLTLYESDSLLHLNSGVWFDWDGLPIAP